MRRQMLGIELEEELQRRGQIALEDRIGRETEQQDRENRHQELGRDLDAAADAARDDDRGDCYEDGMVCGQANRRSQKLVVARPHRSRLRAGEAAERGLDRIADRPAADHGIEAQDEKARDHAQQPGQRPGPAGAVRGRDDADARRRVAPAPPADRELGEHQGHDDQREAQHVEHQEGRAAVGADLIGKFPDAADPDRRADRRQDESDATRPTIARPVRHRPVWSSSHRQRDAGQRRHRALKDAS